MTVPEPTPETNLPVSPEITDAHLKTAMLRAMRLVAIFGVALASIVLLTNGWQSAVLLLVGAAISVSGLWEWQKLIALLSAKLDNQQKTGGARVVVGFFIRLVLAAAVLYGSLKSLHDGSVYALVGGLGLAAFALAIEAAKLVRTR